MERWPVISVHGALATAVLAAGLTGCVPGNPTPSLQESHLTSFGRFGRSVDTSYLTSVVGAYEEPGATTLEEGAAYVFVKPLGSEVWSPEARLKPASTGDLHFGQAVAISVNTIAVAAPQETLFAGNHTGAVHIFDRNGVTWTESAQISTPVHQAWEAFGNAVALMNDTLVVGAVDRDQGTAVDAGAVFVYQRSGGTWTLQQELAAPSAVSADYYGSAVDLAGDTLVVGALRRDAPGAVDAGAVYVYTKSGSTWTLAQTLTASDQAGGDIFGTAVDLEVHADGSRRLVVGAGGGGAASVDGAGAVYVFDAPAGGSFLQTQKLMASDPTITAGFGVDVAVSAGRILVGAPQATGGAGRSGAAYVFELAGGVWTQQDKLTSPTSEANGAVGGSVALAGESALIGATEEDLASTLTSPGTVHVFVKPAMASWFHGQTLTATIVENARTFAMHLSLGAGRLVTSAFSHADVFVRNGPAWSEEQPLPALRLSQVFAASTDGATVAVFGYRDPRFNTDPLGYVQMFTLSSGIWTLQQEFDPDLVSGSDASPSENADDPEVAILGDTMAIGAPRWNGGDGRAYIWTRAGGTWSQAQVFTSPQATTNFDMNYGRHVRLNGQTLVVAEVPTGGKPGSPRSGNVYIYTKHAGLFDVPDQVITETVPSASDYFGGGIAIDGDLLAVYSSASQTLHVYRRTGTTFSLVWSQAIPGVVGSGTSSATNDRIPLAMKGDQIAIGLPFVTVDGVANAGQVEIFVRQLDDTYALDRSFAVTDAPTDLRLGMSVDMDTTHVVAGTDGAFGRIYSFDL